MGKITLTVLEPDFYKDFHCVASDCRSSCCHFNWQISMDKKNYKLLRGLREPNWLSDNFSKYIKLNPDSDRLNNYAIIQQHAESGGCVFETEEGLCRIHAELGEQYLCHTCRSYPRSAIFYSNASTRLAVLENCVAASCEEVTRLLLEKKEPIIFETRTEEAPNEFNSVYYKNVEHRISKTDERPMLEHYHTVRAIAIAVLQSREFSMEKRMVLLCLLLTKLDELEKQNRTDDTPAELERFVASVESGAYNTVLDKPVELDIAKAFANYSWAYSMARNGDSEIVTRCNRGIEECEYSKRMELYSSFMAEREHLLEHFIVNDFYLKGLPFMGTYNIVQCMQYIVSVFASLRFMLSAYLADMGGTLTDIELIDFMAFFGKTVMHTSDSFDNNINLMRYNNITSLPYLITIIKG